MASPAKVAPVNSAMDPALGEDLRMRHEGKYTKAKARKEMAWTGAGLQCVSVTLALHPDLADRTCRHCMSVVETV